MMKCYRQQAPLTDIVDVHIDVEMQTSETEKDRLMILITLPMSGDFYLLLWRFRYDFTENIEFEEAPILLYFIFRGPTESEIKRKICFCKWRDKKAGTL